MEGIMKTIYRNSGAWDRCPHMEEIMIMGHRVELGDRPKSIKNLFLEIVGDLDGGPDAYVILEVERAIALDDPEDCALWFTFVPKDKFVL